MRVYPSQLIFLYLLFFSISIIFLDICIKIQIARTARIILRRAESKGAARPQQPYYCTAHVCQQIWCQFDHIIWSGTYCLLVKSQQGFHGWPFLHHWQSSGRISPVRKCQNISQSVVVWFKLLSVSNCTVSEVKLQGKWDDILPIQMKSFTHFNMLLWHLNEAAPLMLVCCTAH